VQLEELVEIPYGSKIVDGQIHNIIVNKFHGIASYISLFHSLYIENNTAHISVLISSPFLVAPSFLRTSRGPSCGLTVLHSLTSSK
jgi:hypothetical protein